CRGPRYADAVSPRESGGAISGPGAPRIQLGRAAAARTRAALGAPARADAAGAGGVARAAVHRAGRAAVAALGPERGEAAGPPHRGGRRRSAPGALAVGDVAG